MKFNIYNLNYKTFLIRIIIVIIWILIIFGVLFLPNFLDISLKNSINVLAWSGMYDLSYISKFEKDKRIKVHFSYYESNEELLAKLRATKGHGYDLIIPSDYAVYALRKEGLLKKLDKSKLNFLKNLNPALLGHYFDKNNEYSIPAEWAVFGLGINKDYFKDIKNLPESWSLILDNNLISKLSYRIAMANDPLVIIPIAALYLFGTLDDLSVDKLRQIKSLLKCVKEKVEAYTEFRPDYYLISQSAQIVISSSAYIFRALYNYKFIDFVIPKEGTLVTIENFAISSKSLKDDLVYDFINFLMKPESVKHHFESEQALFPVTLDVINHLTLNNSLKKLLTMKKEDFSKFYFFRLDLLKSPVTEEYLRELFIEVKAS